jgi:hypothetical protein
MDLQHVAMHKLDEQLARFLLSMIRRCDRIILMRLDPAETGDDHRRVLAVLTFLEVR